MTNVLIRKMICNGMTPEAANSVCMIYICNASLSVLEAKISRMEEADDVDEIQSESNWTERWRLRC